MAAQGPSDGAEFGPSAMNLSQPYALADQSCTAIKKEIPDYGSYSASGVGMKEEKDVKPMSDASFADNECAQALLALATSGAPVASVQPKIEPCGWSVKAEPQDSHESILKRQLKVEEGGRGLAIRRHCSSDISPEEEALKRICLDHNYAWKSGEERNRWCSNKESSNLYERESFRSEMGCSQDDGRLTKSSKRRSPRRGSLSPRLKNPSKELNHERDMYEPNDTKYKNLNLLLKCLTHEEEERPDSSEEDGIGGGEHACSACPKVFSKKRYLTKHQQRMHSQLPEARVARCTPHEPPAFEANELADCHFCGMRMRRHILVKHMALEHCQDTQPVAQNDETDEVASHSDSSTLSGSEHDRDDVAMATSPRRPLRHILPNKEAAAAQSLLLQQKNTVCCQLCGQRVGRMQLTQHLATAHSVGGEEEPATPACKHSMLQRFLNDSNEQANQECPSCVGRLVANNNYQRSDSRDGADNSRENLSPASTPPLHGSPAVEETPAVSNGCYTVLVNSKRERSGLGKLNCPGQGISSLEMAYPSKLVNGESI